MNARQKNIWSLTGIRCPKCKARGPFAIETIALLHVDEDGNEDQGRPSYDAESYCECDTCEHCGVVREFLPGRRKRE